MRSVVYKAKGEYDYSADQFTIPIPGPGQVLIKVECAPINPSDLYFLQGNYSGTYEYPLVAGGEGAGTVIASGGGFMPWLRTGKRVAFTRQSESAGRFSIGGAYSEYMITSAM